MAAHRTYRCLANDIVPSMVPPLASARGAMMSATELITASMPELRTWIGRRQVVEDDIALTTVRRVAAMLDLDPARFVAGTELPPHWFSMFFQNNAMQRDIGPDGHPNKGIFLPPIPLPRRMGAGRRVKIMGVLRACEPAKRTAEVVAITPKTARTGSLVVLTMRHTIESNGRTVAVEDFDAVYREGITPGESNALPKPIKPPAKATGRKLSSSRMPWSSGIRPSHGTRIGYT